MTLKLSAFSFGYEGWGPHTIDLIQAFDSVEDARGFGPPLIVDTRIRREVRAVGFRGNALGELIGDRYIWMRGLGNRSILTGDRDIVIAKPESAADLLKLVTTAAEQKRRVVYFCSCGPVHGCHRQVVGSLLLKEAARQGIALEVVEWPGGEPQTFDVPVSEEILSKVAKGRKSVPLPDNAPNAFGTPWYSLAILTSPSRQLPVFTGPARKGEGWSLPVLALANDMQASDESALRRATEGLASRSTAANGTRPIHPYCVYHIRHSKLLASIAEHPAGEGVLDEKGDWTPIRKLLQEADQRQERLLMVLDNAEAFVGVNWAGHIDDVHVEFDVDGKASSQIRLSGLKQLTAADWFPRSRLRLKRSGKLLDAGYLRGRLICHTPAFLMSGVVEEPR
jgi:hypothetical protein